MRTLIKKTQKNRWKSQKKYRDAHKKEIAVKAKKYWAEHPELVSTYNHYKLIFKTHHLSHKNYKGMPFFDEWNPKKGGSLKAGADWIVKNIGKRPRGATLHIIEHSEGFVPGNLEWTYPRKQNNQQMFKIIAQQRNRIKKLEARIKELEKR